LWPEVPGNARGSEGAVRGRRLGRANLPVEALPGKLRAALEPVPPERVAEPGTG
jgi:hypothetical protein